MDCRLLQEGIMAKKEAVKNTVVTKIPNDLFKQFRITLVQQGVSSQEVLQTLIEQYVKENSK
jgi:hypothetical protein